MVLTLGCAVSLWRTAAGQAGPSTAATATNENGADTAGVEPTWGLRSRWVALSFAPSSLLLGVTTYLSTDIAAVPLLWVIPLALYLLTFVLVFARWPALPHEWAQRRMAARRTGGQAEARPPGNRFMTWLSVKLVTALDPYRLFLWLQPFLVVMLAVLLPIGGLSELVMFVHLAAFFVTAMVCHGELVRARPQARYLTEFYIWMSVGGVLGGLFNALVAPLTFTSVVEYPLVVVLACCLRPSLAVARRPNRALALDLLIPLLLLAALKGLAWARLWQYFPAWTDQASRLAVIVVPAVAGLVVFGAQRRPVRFGLCLGSVLLASHLWYNATERSIFAGRSFFGVVRVQEAIERVTPQTTCVKHTLVHGSTIHGAQWFLRDVTGAEPAKGHERSRPLTYYSSSGPLGQVVRSLIDPARHHELGVVGLGTGSIAAWGKPGQTITYFEIDPLVVRIASDPRYFTFLAESQARIGMVLGDARLKLAEQPDGRFDLLVIDAFSSDAIPMHLLTREALALYLRKLHPEGILLFHISNRHLDLAPVLANLAADAGVTCRRCLDRQVSDAEMRQGKAGSEWVVLVRDARRLGALGRDRSWKTIAPESRVGVWTDDFSNILTVLKTFR